MPAWGIDMARVPNLSALRLFQQLAQTCSFSETARLANVSQPALSRTIRLLEEQLEARLFDRDTRNVSLTPAGEALFPVVNRLLADFDGAFSEVARSLGGQHGRVVLGALPSFAASTLPRFLAAFQPAHPNISIVVRDGLSGAVYQQMRDREVDFAVLTPPDAHEEDFAFEPLLDDPCALVCRRVDWPDPARTATWRYFTDRPFIAMAAHSSVRELADAAFIRAKLTVRPLYECAQLATVGGLIAAGLGVSALPLSTRPMLDAYDLAWLPLERPRISRQIGITYLAQRSLSPQAERVRDALSAMMRERIAGE